MTRRLSNLVFEGGGVKGIAYVGALEKLAEEELLSDIENVGGTSAGAITALMVGLGYTPEEIRKRMIEMDFSYFLESCRLPVKNVTDFSSWKGLFRKNWLMAWIWVVILFLRLYQNYGLCEGINVRGWLSEAIKSKTGLENPTFEELYGSDSGENLRKMYFIGANLSEGTSEVYSLEDTEDMPVIDAVRISMSFPLAFAPVEKKGSRVDGGIVRNYPIKLFDKVKYLHYRPELEKNIEIYDERNEREKIKTEENKWFFNEESLGFRLDSEEEIEWFTRNKKPEPNEIDNVWEFFLRFINTVLSVQQSYHRRSEDWRRTAYIDTLGVKTLDFNLDSHRKHDLVEEGQKGVEDWLREHWNRE